MGKLRAVFQDKQKLLALLFKYIPVVLGLIMIFITLGIYSSDVAYNNEYYSQVYDSVWDYAFNADIYDDVRYCCIALIIIFFINLILYLTSTILVLVKKKNKGFYLLSISGLLVNIVILVLRIMFQFSGAGGVVLIILNLLLSIASVAFVFVYQKKYKEEVIESGSNVVSNVKTKKPLLVLSIVSLVGLFSLFFIPLFSYKEGTKKISFWLFQALSSESQIIGVQIAFIVVFIAFLGIVLYFIHSISFYFSHEKTFAKKANSLIYSSFAISLIFFLAGYFITFFDILEKEETSTVSYIPVLIMTAVLLVYSVFKGKYDLIDEKELKEKKNFKFEPLIYLAILTIVTLGLLFINVIEIKLEGFGNSSNTKFTGLELLQNSKTLGGGHQLLSFIIFAAILSSSILLIISTCFYIARGKDYYKFSKVSIYVNIIMLFILGMSGFYFKIAQKINEENVLELLKSFGVSVDFEYVNDINSQAIYLFAASLVVLIVAIFRGQLNIVSDSDLLPSFSESTLAKNNSENLADETIDEEEIEDSKKDSTDDFDACPVFTELDMKKPIFDKVLIKKKEYTFENPSLPDLVRFIVNYARESRLHLSYTHEDIATFVAGLGASRLTILQGMSGTGKTSLPKIFTEAILGNCEIVEVESSWRDKNELLGYYNEFSKTYSPKKFTECLYKAKLNPDVVTFIVLDEMNLSRIEYYFSDFLSLMEHEEHKRKIKLLNVKLQRTENNQKYNYLALEEGHTIKIPTNVWFIGTANRDESTFEISDKVYDRAQTMNFNKRAPKVRNFSKPIPQKFMDYETLSHLLNQAIEQGNFEAEDNEIIREVENILQPFNISFGNRVLKQIEEFVKIYCACFNNGEEVVNEAVEKILLSKVVAKLEFKNVDNKDKLVKQFNRLKLYACSEFVSKLNED